MSVIHNPRGYHLIIDALECDLGRISDTDFIYRFLDTYPAEINMTKISTPYVRRYFLNGAERIFGFVMIAESHISVSTNITETKMDLDIYSCKEFDINKAINDSIELFGIKKGTIKVIIRGQQYLEVIEDRLAGGKEFEQRRQLNLSQLKKDSYLFMGKGA